MVSMSPLLDGLNEIQKQAVTTTEGPLLVLSGPGSGKTRVITYRIAYLIEKGVAPESILGLTFTNKASKEMRERITKVIKNAPPWMGTFHSICARILRKEGVHIGIGPNFVIYDSSDSVDLIRDIIKDFGLDPKKVPPTSVAYNISDAKNNLITPTEYAKIAQGQYQATIARVYEQYQQALKKNQALDFDDLIGETVKLFNNAPHTLEKYQNQFNYILVDEYQDTNHAQYIFTKLLARKYRNLCVVGDAAQSIYAFRGADFRNILNFEKDFPEAKLFHLEQNYRSTKTIIGAATKVISLNRSHPVLNIWTENEDGVPIVTYEARNEIEEANFVIRMIEKLAQTYDYRDFAVLYRTNAQSRVLEEGFLKAGIPYTLVGGTRFYDRKEVKDVLSYLRLILNPNDSVSLKRVINTPPRGIGPASLKDTSNPKVTNFYNLMQSLRNKSELLNSMETIDMVMSSTHYLDYLSDGTPEGEVRVENVKELRSVAEQFPKLNDFLENVSLVEQEYGEKESRNQDSATGAITLMTLHSAKGLEFPIVFMVGMEEGLFPHSRSLLDNGELEEERRLCYVGMTRAKKQLYFTYTQERLFFGTRTSGIVSRFLTDIPEEFLIPIRG